MSNFTRFIAIMVFVILIIVAAGLAIDGIFTHINHQNIETLEELEQRY